mgnify:FL=1
MKKLSSPILAIVFLLVTVSSLFVFVQADSVEPEKPYEVFQNFEDMSTQEDLEGFFTRLSFDEDSSATLSLSEDGGFEGSKAAQIVFDDLAYYSDIGDQEDVTNQYTATGEGLSFWLKTEQPTRFKLRILENWAGYDGEEISVEAGEHFVQIPWTSVKSGDTSLTTDPENKLMRVRLEFLNDGDSGFLENTVLIDEIGYYSTPEPEPSETEPPEPAEPEQPYGIYQNFEGMSSQEDLDAFMMVDIDEDSEVTLGLSEDGGFEGSKAAKIEYNQIGDWLNFLDENYQAQHFTASGEGFSFWIKTDNEIRVRLYIFDDWLDMFGEYITLSPGEHFVQVPWSTIKGTRTVEDGDGNPIIDEETGEEETEEVALNQGSDNTIMMIKIQVFREGNEKVPGTLYLDEIGYVNYEPPAPTTKPTLPEGESVVLFNATRGSSPWPCIQGDPVYCNVFKVEDDPRFDFYFKFSLLEDFSQGGMFIYNNLDGVGTMAAADISYGYEKGYVRFWVKASAAKSFSVYFSAEGEVPSAKTTVTVDEANVWQEVRIPLATFTFTNPMKAEKVFNFCVAGNDVDGEAFAAGDTLKIAGIKVYSQEPEDIEVEDGYDKDPEDIALKYPIGTDDDSEVIWYTDPSSPFDLSGGAGEVTVEDASDLDGFDQVFKWVLGEEFKTAYRGLYLYGDAVDVINYLDTAYLSFYVKSSKAGRIMLALNDDAYNYGQRHIVYVDKANEWVEVRVPIAKLVSFQDAEYISSIFISDAYRPYSWSYENYDGEIINTGEGYLEVGDTLYLSPFSIKAGAEVIDGGNDDDDDDNDNDNENEDKDKTPIGDDGTKTPPTGVNSSLPFAAIPFSTLLISIAAYKKSKTKKYSCQ